MSSVKLWELPNIFQKLSVTTVESICMSFLVSLLNIKMCSFIFGKKNIYLKKKSVRDSFVSTIKHYDVLKK